MAIHKIELMYKLFGKSPNDDEICLNCSNFDHVVGGYSKCKAYGRSHSEATDWKQKQRACGLYNQTYKGRRVVELVQPDRRINDNDQIEGQINMFNYLNED